MAKNEWSEPQSLTDRRKQWAEDEMIEQIASDLNPQLSAIAKKEWARLQEERAAEK